MKRLFLVLAASTAMLAALAGAHVPTPSAQAAASDDKQAAKPPRVCFDTRRMSKWASDGDVIINVKLQTGAVYQVTLANPCPGLNMYRTLAFDTSFNSTICDGEHATVITRSGAGPLRCPIKSIREMSKEEAAALPDETRP